MSALEGGLIIAFILALSGAGTVALIRRGRAAGALCDRIIRETCGRPPYLAARWDDDTQQWVNTETHDVGPDSLRLLEDLEAQLKAYGAQVADYYDTTPGDR
jgi:hypothetical protein